MADLVNNPTTLNNCSGPATLVPRRREPILSPARGFRWLRRLLPLAPILACLYVFRGPLLKAVASFLIVNQPTEGNTLLIFDERGTLYDEAGRLYRSGGVFRVLFYQLQPRRSEQVGAVLPGNITSRRELAQRGVPEKNMSVLAAQGRRTWDKAAALADWLREHPQEKLVLLCDRFESRGIRNVLDRSLAGPDADRVHLQAAADPRYDETNWWRRKEGTIDLFNGYIRLGYVWVNGDGGEVRPDLAPDDYEKLVGDSP